MSNNRDSTIYHGEKGLSQAICKAGLKVEGLISRDRFVSRLKELDETVLQGIVARMAQEDADGEKRCTEFVEAAMRDEAWTERFIGWVEKELSETGVYSASAGFVTPAMRFCGMAFLKKARDRHFHIARMRVLEMEAGCGCR